MASIVKSGSGWRVQVYVQGIRESATFERKADAQDWAKAREKELREMAEVAGKPLNRDRLRFLELSNLHSEDKIVSTAFAARPSSGIYFLIRDKKIVYVGKSVNVHARVATHQKQKEFDQINFVECPVEQLHQIEQLYIRKFNPELNIAGRTDHLPALEEIEWQA